LLKCP